MGDPVLDHTEHPKTTTEQPVSILSPTIQARLLLTHYTARWNSPDRLLQTPWLI